MKRADGTIHLGQDVIADCGTPIVAAHDGVVKSAGYSEGYGNYVVSTDGDPLRLRLRPHEGPLAGPRRQAGHVGQRLGSVGQTGSDSGVCHLHFELWKGRWFAGGSRSDPLPHLHTWDRFSGGPLQDGADAASARTRRASASSTTRPVAGWPYSHSMVPGGFEVRSSVTRLTPRTSLMIRLETRSSRS